MDCDICTRPQEALTANPEAPRTEAGGLACPACRGRVAAGVAAERFQVSVRTAQRWATRGRQYGAVGMTESGYGPLVPDPKGVLDLCRRPRR
ncbi:hypothetical protein GCM10022214_34710 [Actinomadura miaoliensis]|uniref:Helix-turn-helix domain-containing protein n=1 Tax=Actinomadura miaoliensis TaxID=430685 RepID=A0ABP7VUZ1_9ACTN